MSCASPAPLYRGAGDCDEATGRVDCIQIPSLEPRPWTPTATCSFGVLALQADLLDSARFAEACSAWAARKEVPLADLLVERRSRLRETVPAAGALVPVRGRLARAAADATQDPRPSRTGNAAMSRTA